MTTLEALATGVPVVIPGEVGIHPQLPHIPGIYRYVANNYDSLAVALGQALDELGTIDRASLRAAVVPHSIPAFCESTRAAFEQHFTQTALVAPKKTWKSNAGIYIVAFGEPARKCAVRCIRSCKRMMPEIPIALCATEPLNVGERVVATGRRGSFLSGRQNGNAGALVIREPYLGRCTPSRFVSLFLVMSGMLVIAIQPLQAR